MCAFCFADIHLIEPASETDLRGIADELKLGISDDDLKEYTSEQTPLVPVQPFPYPITLKTCQRLEILEMFGNLAKCNYIVFAQDFMRAFPMVQERISYGIEQHSHMRASEVKSSWRASSQPTVTLFTQYNSFYRSYLKLFLRNNGIAVV